VPPVRANCLVGAMVVSPWKVPDVTSQLSELAELLN
jgi:hypothetical protein